MGWLQVHVIDAEAGADLSQAGPTMVYDAAANTATLAAAERCGGSGGALRGVVAR